LWGPLCGRTGRTCLNPPLFIGRVIKDSLMRNRTFRLIVECWWKWFGSTKTKSYTHCMADQFSANRDPL